MSKVNKTLVCVLVLVTGVFFDAQIAAAASAEKQLQKGIEAYRNNDNDKAMDYFVDVLMNGDNEQASTANRYIDAIHNQIGGIRTPVEVDVAYPDQPNQMVLDEATNMANYGTERLSTLASQAEATVRETSADWEQAPKTLTEQIEERQLAGYAVGDGMTPLTDQQGAWADQAAVLNEEVANTIDTTVQDLDAIEEQYNQEVETATQVLGTVPAREQVLTTSYVPALTTPSSTFSDLTSDSAVEARTIYTMQKLQSMTNSVMDTLKNTPGVHLYTRTDGLPDAIDIDEGVLFQGNSFRPESFATLNHIYELLALTQGAHYTILPAGSYTDDVTLAGIRQAMALKSYLVKRGISQGKISYNMGLVDEEVPAQFSNLKGLSIVFDYDAKLPTRLLENEGNEKAPLLSMAIVPQCHAIDRSLGEAYAIDFSVLETVNTLDNWTLQIILHGRDGKYYVVRQLEGFAPVYHQILWNGRKGIIGPELPCGKYTVVLTGIDSNGDKQTLRRRIIVKCNGDTPLGSCEAGKCQETTKTVSTTQKTALNYKSARLWKKPGRIMRDGEFKEEVVAQQEVAQGNREEQGAAASSSTSTHTVTKTVRNIVVDDHTPATTTTTSSYSSYEAMPSGSASYSSSTETMTNNPYGEPYEEEYGY